MGMVTDVWLTEAYTDCQEDRPLVRKFAGMKGEAGKYVNGNAGFRFRGFTICFKRGETAY